MKQRLSDSIEDYLLHRMSQGKALGTRNNDKQVLLAFLAVTGNVYTDNVTERHMDEYMASRARKGLVSSTLALHHNCLAAFFKWACRTRRAPRDRSPMEGRQAPRVEQRERERVAVGKFPTLLDAAGSRDARDRVYIALGLYLFLRTGEIAQVRVGDVDLDSGSVFTRIEKSRREDSMPIGSELDGELRSWMTRYSLACGSLDPKWRLVPARRLVQVPGQRVGSGETVYVPDRPVGCASRDIVHPALRAIGFMEREGLKGEGGHTLRRSGARAYFDALSARGYDYALRVVKEMLHHKSVVDTERYLGIGMDRRERDILVRGEEMFPSLDDVVRLDSRRGKQAGEHRGV